MELRIWLKRLVSKKFRTFMDENGLCLPKKLTYEDLTEKEKRQMFETLQVIEDLFFIHEEVQFFCDVEERLNNDVYKDFVRYAIRDANAFIKKVWFLSHSAVSPCCHRNFEETLKKYKKEMEDV